MSELKAFNMPRYAGEFTIHEVYLKSEADKWIEEKDAEIARLKAIRKVHVEAIESMGAGLLQDEEKNRHSKYKRCLAMAKRCEAEAHKCLTQQCALVSFQDTDRFQYLQRNFMHFSRWHKRWLELAEQFKEAK